MRPSERDTRTSLTGQVGIFFYTGDGLLLHACPLSDAQPYGDFLNYPKSHDTVWERLHRWKYGVDFDYYPRGRVIYNRLEDCYLLYYDACIEREAAELAERFGDAEVRLVRDGHYQCHNCNPDYAFIER